jgi:hypothetical protein
MHARTPQPLTVVTDLGVALLYIGAKGRRLDESLVGVFIVFDRDLAWLRKRTGPVFFSLRLKKPIV